MSRQMIGSTFGRLTVIGESSRVSKNRNRYYLCSCSCGNSDVEVRGDYLRSGHTVSCGCEASSILRDRNTTHGMYGTRIYRIWKNMRNRCENSESQDYQSYGGRGITVCEEWKSFEQFYADMGLPPTETATIERRQNHLGYSPDNCRWAEPREQANNRRSNVYLEYAGRKQTVAQWAREIGINVNTLRFRLRSGWSTERALTT